MRYITGEEMGNFVNTKCQSIRKYNNPTVNATNLLATEFQNRKQILSELKRKKEKKKKETHNYSWIFTTLSQ